jgi:AraC-like DNA-binding protein
VRVHRFLPSERLQPFVRAFTIVETIETTAQTLSAPLPEPGLILGLRFAGSASLLEGAAVRPLPNACVTGVRTSIRRICTSPGGGIIVTAFRPLGAAQFFDEPLHELHNDLVALSDVSRRSHVTQLELRLCAARTHAQRVAIVDDYLCSRLTTREPDPIVAEAVWTIRRTGGAGRVGPLSKHLGLSRDRFEKRFRRVVGASPKQFASILRFRRAVAGYRAGFTLARLATDAGYFDQSHLVRDFRSFTGEAPGEFLRAGKYW